MKESKVKWVTTTLFLAAVSSALAAVHYVNVNSFNATSPYTNWTTAASIIQDAVDVAVAGDEVVVTNGTYATGGRFVSVIGGMTNRVAVDKPLLLRSVNGPLFTTIQGRQVPGAVNGDDAIRCVYLTNGASLSGFTLTNGFSSSGGGASGGTLSNCVLTGNSASGPFFSGYGGGAAGCTLNNCVLSSNSSSGLYAGGAYYCTLNHCTLSGNSGYIGGGATFCTLNDCTLTSNSASAGGGGADESTLNNCTLTGNSGSGAYRSTLNNCTLTANSNSGAEESTLNNCALTGNFGDGAKQSIVRNCVLTGNSGVGARYCLMTNCTVTGNSAGGAAGCGWYPGCTLNNCLLYFNGGPNYDSSSTLYFCCTTPEPAIGIGNISLDPQLASVSHLSAGSPCRGAGNAAYVSGTDIDGEPWLNPPSIGCDEYHAGAVTGPLSVGISASFTNVLIGFTVQLATLIEGRTTGSVWDFGDGITATNQPYTSHAWAALGDFAVVLRAYNETKPGGISSTVTVHVVNGVHYAAADSPNPVAPYASWATAATNIQDAINVVEPGGPVVVMVTNGVYTPVAASGPLTVRSVNGPLFTLINGGRSNLCVSLALDATLSGFTLTNGAGGASGGMLSNCIITGNTSYGASSSTLNNCTITGNTTGGVSACALNNCALAGNFGVGAISSTLTNCTLTGNSGGGTSGCTLKNCIVYFNTAAQAANYDPYTALDYCCTIPQPTNGVGNISSDPQLASATHLSAASRCRGTANPAYASGTDIDGEAWLSPPSIGCDEYHAGAVGGLLSVRLAASFTNALVGFTVQFTALIDGPTTASSWDFGDGTTLTNQPYTAHAWTAPGDYAVVLRAYNETQPGGMGTTVVVHVGNGVHYVAADSANPAAPYASWATAATNIQDAVSLVEAGGPVVVVVTNGNYASVVASGPITVRSVNGPLFTVINGGQSNLCASLTNGAGLSGFTLTNGTGGASGGTLIHCTLTGNPWYGASSSTLSNCTLTGNSYGATYSTLNNCTLSANTYSGAFACTLNSCALVGNSGFGASSSGLTNCTLIGNSGGGASGCALNNCIVYFNTAGLGVNYDSYSTLNYCCATPLPTNGVGNISSDPQLVSSSHLSAGSPCREAGNAAYSNGTDIDGELWLNPPSIGCDEYYAGALTGPLIVAIAAPYTNVVVGYAARFIGLVDGPTAATSWDFGDGSTATNQPLTAHAWTAVGDYTVVLRAYNLSQPRGITATITVHVVTGVHYVAAASIHPVAPYTSWATAATNIQDAINAAEPGGARVEVADGVYSPINVPALTKVHSINGPQFTTIRGGGGTRCANLATNAVLSGFTLTNGFATGYGGGAYGGILTNCTLTGNVAEAPLNYGYVCIYYDPVYHFCRASAAGYSVGDAFGGGAVYCTLNDCTLAGNVVESPLLYNPNNGFRQVYSSYSLGSAYGGGAAFCTLINCTLTNNLAREEPLRDSYYDFIDNRGGYSRQVAGGGAYSCTLTNCALSNNRAQGFSGYIGHYDPFDPRGSVYVDVSALGGGTLDCTLANCTLTGNQGESAYSCTLLNCALTGNAGTGAIHSTLNNCTLTGNSSGAYNSTLTNCIVYFNGGANYDSSCSLNYCCTTPQPTNGVGNISSDPQLASLSHLSVFSPCIGKGTAAAVSGMDIDGEAWANPPSMGCDEYHAGAVTGPLSVDIAPSFTNVTIGYAMSLTALVEGRSDLSVWSFGDGDLEVNEPYVTHSWSVPGDYLVALWCYSDSHPDGISATLTIHVGTGVHYVASASSSPAAPYSSWATAATNIQQAINAATEAGTLVVLVTNGTYSAITAVSPLSVRSVNGATFTLIDGALSSRCATLGFGASIAGFTVLNGFSSDAGGGVSGGTVIDCTLRGNLAAVGGGAYSSTLDSCTLTGNWATNSGGAASASTLNNCYLLANSSSSGGGAGSCTLNNCALTGNWATNSGGAAYGCTLGNCTLTGNWAASGGGAADSALNNCIDYFNSSTNGANYDAFSTLNYCCTTPLPTNGLANISADPLLASATHLSAVSSCRGAGNAAYATGTDIDGEPWAHLPSIGCDEYHAGAVTGPLNLGIRATFTTVAVGFTVRFTALVDGRTTASIWDFADGMTVTNQPYTEHSWTAPGDYALVLRAYNESYPDGINASLILHVTNEVHYVAAGSAHPIPPYASWDTAANDIQEAISAAIYPGAQVLVANGNYAPITVNKAASVRSANGALFTFIDGGHSNRCVLLGDDAAVSGFTLTNGFSQFGGGASGGTLNGCILSRNCAAESGGGAYYSTLNNCTLIGNTVAGTNGSGGGAAYSILNDCMLTNNSARTGGATFYGSLNHCALIANLATNSGGGAAYSELNDCALTNNWAAIGGASFYGALNNCPLFGNSATNSGGGSFGSALRDCSLIHNSAQEGAGLDSGTANNCTFTGNSAFNGGATAYSALNDCTLTANSATTGGAVYYGTLNKCVFIGNAAINSGGGAFGGTLNICALSDNSAQEGAGLNSSTANNCTITGNSAFNGGGAAASKLNGCILTNNSALNLGGGALESTLNSCALNANSASSGGGAFDCALTNCTVTANSAFYNGGGVSFSTLNNCIAYFNTAVQWANYDSGSLLDYSCTMPLPTNGVGNISSNPLLANAFHLSAYSPCRGAGNAAYATGTDIDGEFWASPPSIGCDEYYTASATGDLVVAIITPFTSVTVGLPLEFTTLIAGRTTASSWDFGDGVTATNQLIVSHSWAGLGDYSLVLRAFNESNPEGISATVTIHVVPRPVYYVSVDSLNPVAPYSSWATAATDIQDAVDVATVAGSQVLVTNGIYARGARLTVGDAIVNRLVVDKPLSLQSVNGPQFTIIDGGRSNRCVHLAYYASLSGFTLTNGLMQNDGAVFGGALTNCTLTGNNGASYCTLTYCSLTNWAGASYCTLNNCMLTANPGVGASYSTLNNCMLSSNYVAAEYSTLNNCTLTGNEAYGALGCAMTNCIAYFNTAAPGVNYDALSTLNYCCTTPLPANGVGNISSDPQLASAWRLSAASPCRGAGSAVSAIGTDLDGEAWANPPSIGCDEYHAGALTGPLSVGITSSFTNVPIGFTLQLVGTIEGRPASNSWDFGDGITATNQLYVSHTWAALGDYAVILNAYNTGNPDGVSTTITIHVVPQPIHYVVANSLAPVAPYTSWATAARNIQDAVDAATVPAALVLVSNGTYAAGGRADELAVVIVDKPLTVRSINGPLFTAINGNGTNRCVTLLKEAIISGFTLTNGLEGAALGIVTNCTLGGNAVGASFSTLYNCTLTENNAYEYGGGAYASTLYNCTLSRNSCLYGGGGAYACTLNNCTLTDNDSFPLGGGAMNCTLNNCIAYFNTGGNYQDCSLNNCCTTPDPGGIGNFTSPPLFVNQASGNLRLQTNSPCINAGNNIFAVGCTDLDDNPRIQGGAVDIGAYEFQSPVSMISYAWLQQFNLPIHPSTDTADPDGDGLNNWQEWRCGTDPTNALSALRMLALAGGGTNVMVSWQSVTGVSYFLERATSLATPAAFASLASNIHGQPGTTSYADTNAIGAGPWFYRVGIGSP